ncbi:MAG: T9SS type A sorting domain-containing protein [Bacteroidia bacterium]|nr:T9SS type A sorting domain-containing protein [Bacteroidia bacterium]
MRNIIITLLVLSINICHAQYKNSVWCFGDSARIDFVNGVPLAGSSVVDSRGTCTSIADSSSNLLFYTGNDPNYNSFPAYVQRGIVYTKSNTVMDNGDSLISVGWYNEHIIIPNPKGDNTFFLFNVGATYGLHTGLFVSVVNLNYNMGLGRVTVKNRPLTDSVIFADALGAVKQGNGRDWWVVAKPLFRNSTSLVPSDTFYVYLVTPDSIHAPIKQRIGTDRGWGLANLTFSPKGDKLNLIMSDGIIEVFDFNRCTGILSNANIIYNTPLFPNGNNAFSGSAFSPNGNFLYVTQGGNLPPYYILQIDLSNNDIDTVAQVTSFGTSFTRGTGTLRLAPDGKIYIATIARDSIGGIWYPYPSNFYSPDNMYLATIDSPDVKGVGCSYNPYSFYLGGKRCYFGLPNNPDYELGALAGSGCDTLTNLTPDPTPLERGVRIFPNPAKDFIFIRGTGITSIEIRNIAGVVLKKQTFNYQGEVIVSVSLQNYSQGIYQVKASSETEEKTAKLIIIR